MDLFSDISVLKRGLDFSTTQQKVIAQNIANVDTPHYKAKSASFQEFYNEAMETSLQAYQTDARHLPFRSRLQAPGVLSYDRFSYRTDGNGVDLDKEQANLATNQLYYNALIERLNGKFNTLKSSIKGS